MVEGFSIAAGPALRVGSSGVQPGAYLAAELELRWGIRVGLRAMAHTSERRDVVFSYPAADPQALGSVEVNAAYLLLHGGACLGDLAYLCGSANLGLAAHWVAAHGPDLHGQGLITLVEPAVGLGASAGYRFFAGLNAELSVLGLVPLLQKPVAVRGVGVIYEPPQLPVIIALCVGWLFS